MIKALNTLKQEFQNLLEYNNIRGYALSLEFNSLSKTIKTEAHFSQSDINTSVIAVQLLNNNSPIILDEASVVYANVERADGTIVTNKCTVIDASMGAIIVPFSTLSTEIVGTNRFEIVVRHTGNFKILSPKVSYRVYQSIDIFYEEPSTEEVNVLDVLVDEVVSLKGAVVATNTAINEEMAERTLIEQSRQQAEALRVSQELERQSSIASMKASEITREEQEVERQLSMENIQNTFTNKVSIVNNKIEVVDSKISELDARTKEFDTVIKVAHNGMVSAETERKSSEQGRKSAESERVQFFNGAKVDEATRISNETKRESQETSRVNSFKNMSSTFDSKVQVVDGKVSEISGKITEATQKITQFSNDEATRKTEHSARKSEFDNIIKADHASMVSAENTRKSQEQSRVSAENERKSFYNQAKVDEASRVTADVVREERVETLEARVDQKIAEYNTQTLITNAEIDTIIANALK